jgi:hypothetical protein
VHDRVGVADRGSEVVVSPDRPHLAAQVRAQPAGPTTTTG